MVIAGIFGVPREDRHLFTGWSKDILEFFGSPQPDRGQALRAESSLTAFRGYLEGLIEERRARPREDAITTLIRAEGHDDASSDDEIIANCILFLMAGHVTTTTLIGNGVLALLRHPRQLAALRGEPGLIDNAVEEVLRFDPPVQRVRRVATRDIELRGQRIRGGEFVVPVIGAANRDPLVFIEPDTFAVGRENASDHLGFGYGIHFCIGAGLARLEAPIAIAALIRFAPELRLVDAWVPSFTSGALTRVLDSLPVEFRCSVFGNCRLSRGTARRRVRSGQSPFANRLCLVFETSRRRAGKTFGSL
jgi:cytochrome P450